MSGNDTFRLSNGPRRDLSAGQALIMAQIAFDEGRLNDARRLINICHSFCAEMLHQVDMATASRSFDPFDDAGP